jgi:hypothetical protein
VLLEITCLPWRLPVHEPRRSNVGTLPAKALNGSEGWLTRRHGIPVGVDDEDQPSDERGIDIA